MAITTPAPPRSPHSEECERAVLAGVLLEPEFLPEISARLAVEHFHEQRHRAIYGAILDLQETGQPLDIRTLQVQLEEQDKLEQVGGVAYLASLELDLPDFSRLDTYLATLTKLAARRRVLDAARNVVLSGGESTQVEALRGALDDGSAPDARRVWTLRELLEDPDAVKLPPPIIPKLAWPGRATLFASPEKLGKSTLATAAAAAVSTGADFLALPTRAGTVLWATEEHVGDVARRLRDFGADPDRVTVMQWGPHALSDLRAEAERLQPALLVVDTLAAIAEHASPDSGSASDWAAIMRPLVRIARTTGCALLILHHSRRTDGLYRDSSEIGAAVDVIAEMSGPATGSVRRIAYRGRYGRGSFSVRLVGRGFELVSEEDASALEVAVVEFVRDHPGCTQKKIRGGVVGRTSHLRQVLIELVTSGQIVNLGTETSHSYCLSKAVPEDLEQTTLGTAFDAEAAPPVPPVPGCGNKESSATGPRPGRQAVPLFPPNRGTGGRSTDQPEQEKTEEGSQE